MIQSDLFLDHLQNMSDVFQICRRKLKTISHSDWRTALMTQVCGGRSCMCWRYCSCIKAPEGLLSYPSLSLSGSLFSNSHLSITFAPSHVSTNTWEEEEEEPAIAHAALEMPQQDCRIVVLFFFSSFLHICFWGLMCACGARWTLSWVRECGLFCRRHLGLHMVQQTVVREAGGHVGGHPYGGLSPIHSMGHRHKWQNKRLGANPAKTNACLSPHNYGAHPPLWKQWLTSVKGECVLQHCLISIRPKDNYTDEK